MIKKIIIAMLIINVLSVCFNDKEFNYSNKNNYNKQEETFLNLENLKNYAKTNITNSSIIHYTKETTRKILNTGKVIIYDIINKFDEEPLDNTKQNF